MPNRINLVRIILTISVGFHILVAFMKEYAAYDTMGAIFNLGIAIILQLFLITTLIEVK